MILSAAITENLIIQEKRKKKKKNVATFGSSWCQTQDKGRQSCIPPKTLSTVSAQHQQSTFLGASSQAFDKL